MGIEAELTGVYRAHGSVLGLFLRAPRRDCSERSPRLRAERRVLSLLPTDSCSRPVNSRAAEKEPQLGVTLGGRHEEQSPGLLVSGGTGGGAV